MCAGRVESDANATEFPSGQQKQIIIDGKQYELVHLTEVLDRVEAVIPHLTLQFSRLHERMMISDAPNEEADGVRLRHFAMNAFVNGVIVDRKVDEEFMELITGLIARVQLETLMYRFKYGKDYEYLDEIRVMVSSIIFFKNLQGVPAATTDDWPAIWPNREGDLYEIACKMSAAKYGDMRDRRASALLFSQLLSNRPITTNNITTGNVGMHAYVTTGHTLQLLWECISGVALQDIKDSSGVSYCFSQADLSDIDALQLLSHEGVKAIRTCDGKTYHNANFDSVEVWTLSDPGSKYIDVITKSLYVILTYLYVCVAVCISVLGAVLNWGRRKSPLQRTFDAAGLLAILCVAALISLKWGVGMEAVLETLLLGRRRLTSLDGLGQYHGMNLKKVVVALAKGKEVGFVSAANSCFVSGPKTGTIDLPLMLTERDLYGSIIIGATFAFDNKGAWHVVETRDDKLHLGEISLKGQAIYALRGNGNRYVGC